MNRASLIVQSAVKPLLLTVVFCTCFYFSQSRRIEVESSIDDKFFLTVCAQFKSEESILSEFVRIFTFETDNDVATISFIFQSSGFAVGKAHQKGFVTLTPNVGEM